MVCFSFSLLARTALRRLQGYKKYTPYRICSATECLPLGSFPVPFSHGRLVPRLSAMSAWDKPEELQRPVPDEIGVSLQEDDDEADTAEDMHAQAAQVAEFVAEMELASPEILRVTPAVRALPALLSSLLVAPVVPFFATFFLGFEAPRMKQQTQEG